MARKTTIKTTFLETMTEHANSFLTDHQKMNIAKKKYLINNRDDILLVREVGYSFSIIAEVATLELLKTDVPKSFMAKNKEGEEEERETKFGIGEIKRFCEPESEA